MARFRRGVGPERDQTGATNTNLRIDQSTGRPTHKIKKKKKKKKKNEKKTTEKKKKKKKTTR